MDLKVDFGKIEKKWQKKWEEKKIFESKENNKKKKFYILEMFPYPSATGLHIGHAFNYTIGDVYARFKRMNDFNVLHPMGFDSLGLPAENAAISAGTHPEEYTKNSINNYIKQQKALGLAYDWERKIETQDSEYYKWDQWIFLKMFEKGLAYRKKASVNWCPKCKTVLANEQVHFGKCWRHEETDVELKHLDQWYLKITEYVEELNDFSKLQNWPELIKKLQKNWIGKSHGIDIIFEINKEKWSVFTTRPDTIYGVTFMVISAQHPRLMELVTKEQKKEVEKLLKKIKSTSEKDMEDLEKEGAFTGSYAINPITKEKIPVYTGNFVVADYGCGMVMAVPTHDQRDFEFAKKYKIPMKIVIQPELGELKVDKMIRAYTGNGNLVDSGEFNGMYNIEAIDSVSDYLGEKKLGKKVVQYKLRDWLISRQRYWGTPIPIIYCDKCGIVPVLEKELPVILPKDVKFGKGNPLETNEKFVNAKCPKCGAKARRETDTMDTFVNSSWYYLRYCDPQNKKEIFDKKKANYWCPMDVYIGGKEHACMHLMYIRFYTKFLRDLKLLNFDEPTNRMFNQGYVYGKDGRKMSKSYGNVVEPLETIKKFGADALRLYLVSVASPDSDFIWSDSEMQGTSRFVSRVMNYFESVKIKKSDEKTESKLNQTIKEVKKYFEEIQYNLAVIKVRKLFETLPEQVSKGDLEKYLKLLYPFCPHITEELWEKLGNKNFISLEKWPVADGSKINEKFEQQDKDVEKLAEDINNISKILNEKSKKQSTRAFVYVLPNEIEFYAEALKKIQKKTGLKLDIFSVGDKEKYDPQGKSSKVKPNRPAIYLE
ncbi:MAG: leucine--tRNA ligase [archaeon]